MKSNILSPWKRHHALNRYTRLHPIYNNRARLVEGGPKGWTCGANYSYPDTIFKTKEEAMTAYDKHLTQQGFYLL